MVFLKDLKILLAEDNEINQRLATMLFRQLGLVCDIVSNGLEAVQKFGESKYDLVLMDLQMPVMDGLESSLKIRAVEQESGNKHRSIIIALSANEPSETLRDCMESGMDDFLEKPLLADKLSNIISRYFR